MQNSILYKRSTTLPRTRGHFHRPRIDGLLDKMSDRHLIAVTAGAGWGKTHAVSAFLSGSPARVMWLQLSELDNHPTRFWEEFVYIMSFQNEEISLLLERLGFPDSLAEFDQFLHIFAKEIYTQDQVVFVLDDFHLIYDEMIIRFVENLVSARLENFCVIINSRTKLSLNFTGAPADDLMGMITIEDLRFTPDEIENYLKHHGISMTAREQKKVLSFTEGWPLALYLVGLSIKKGGMVSNDPIAGAAPLIFDMIEREMFSEYDPEMQKFLIKTSLLKTFPVGLIKILAGGNLDAATEIIETNMFIYSNTQLGYCNFHHLFLEFLNEKQKYLTEQEITDTYVKAAEWCVANDLKLEALTYYDKCGRYDKILNIMMNYGTATFPKTVAEFYIGLIDKFPEELVKKNPIVHVHHAGLLLNNAEIQPAIQELLETRKELEAMPPTQENKTVLGEIYCMLGLLSLGGCNYDFRELFKKASKCFPDGGSMIDNTAMPINTKYSIMLASPAPGELEKMEAAMFDGIPYVSKATRGYAQGMEYLASAEAAYFTGDMKKAAKNAYEAIYRAREKQVNDIASSGYFLLMRIEAVNGDYKGVVSHLKQLRVYVEELENKRNFQGMPDVAEGWFHITVGDPEKVAGWIVHDSSGVLAPYSTGMERMVKAKYMLTEGKYYELLAWLGQSEELFRQNNMWLILLDNLIYKSIAFHHIHDEAQTVSAFREAYDIAHGNKLVMQFAEHGSDMRAVVYAVKRSGLNTIPETWLDEIYTKSTTYEKHLNNMKSQYRQTSGLAPKAAVKFTKREKEMLGCLCQGLTNKEIASALYVSISAVKKSLNNIYIKMNATNRADAVRIAIQAGLNR